MTEGDAWRPVPAELDVPAYVYENRAANTGHIYPPPTEQSWELAAANGDLEFFGDVSEWQGVPVDRSYPYRQFSFRVCDGTYLDKLGSQNWATAKQLMNDPSHPLEIVYPYVVYRPGTWETVAVYLRSLFGDRFPDRVAPMIDAEPFGGQVVGNHSTELNLWADHLAAMTVGGQKSVIGYSYTSGFQELWPNFPPWLKRRTASYGTWDPGFYDWQYSGGTGTGGHPGWPHGAGPWQLCDMNVTQRPIEQIITDLGFTGSNVSLTDQEHAWLQQNNDRIVNVILDEHHGQSLPAIKAAVDTVEPTLTTILAKLDAQAADIAEIKAKLDQPPSSGLTYGSQVILSMPQLPSEPV